MLSTVSINPIEYQELNGKYPKISLNQDLQRFFEWSIRSGLIPLPVAPRNEQIKDKNGKIKFTGKNPSFINDRGEWELVDWKKYSDDDEYPTVDQYRLWWKHPQVMIGSLGTDHAGFIDLDSKNFSGVGVSCENAFQALKLLNGWDESKNYIEFTQSDGYHTLLNTTTPADNRTNYKLDKNGRNVGELRFKGKFTVHFPTPGYRPFSNGLEAVLIESIDSIKGIILKEKDSVETIDSNTVNPIKTNDSIELQRLGSKTSSEILSGVDIKGDRSHSLTTAINDWIGCENWCRSNGVKYHPSARELAKEAGKALGIDDIRVTRIFKTCSENSRSSVVDRGGDDAMWKKIESFKKLFEPTTRETTAPIASSTPTTGIKSSLQKWQDTCDRIKEAIDACGTNKIALEGCLQIISRDSGVPLKTILKQVDVIEKEGQEEKDPLFSIGDLFADPDLKVRYLIDTFLPETGLMLLTGTAKDGKSTLVYEMIASLVTGDSFLGELVNKRINVLFYQCEESKQTIKRNLEGKGLEEYSDRIYLRQSLDITDPDKLRETLKRDLARTKAKVIVCDSLRKINQIAGVSENSAEYAQPLYNLQKLSEELGVLIIVIYHNNKNKEAIGVSRVSGSGAIAGACDYIMQLRRCSNSPTDRTRFLELEGRNNFKGHYRIEYEKLEPPKYRFNNLGECGVSEEQATMKDRILDYMRQASTEIHIQGKFTARNIQEGIANFSNSVYFVLDRLIDYGRVFSWKEGKNRIYSLYPQGGVGNLYVVRNTNTLPPLEFRCENDLKPLPQKDSTFSHTISSTTDNNNISSVENSKPLINKDSSFSHGFHIHPVEELPETIEPTIDENLFSQPENDVKIDVKIQDQDVPTVTTDREINTISEVGGRDLKVEETVKLPSVDARPKTRFQRSNMTDPNDTYMTAFLVEGIEHEVKLGDRVNHIELSEPVRITRINNGWVKFDFPHNTREYKLTGCRQIK